MGDMYEVLSEAVVGALGTALSRLEAVVGAAESRSEETELTAARKAVGEVCARAVEGTAHAVRERVEHLENLRAQYQVILAVLLKRQGCEAVITSRELAALQDDGDWAFELESNQETGSITARLSAADRRGS